MYVTRIFFPYIVVGLAYYCNSTIIKWNMTLIIPQYSIKTAIHSVCLICFCSTIGRCLNWKKEAGYNKVRIRVWLKEAHFVGLPRYYNCLLSWLVVDLYNWILSISKYLLTPIYCDAVDLLWFVFNQKYLQYQNIVLKTILVTYFIGIGFICSENCS